MPWYYIVIVVVCLILSAFFSAADMVYSIVNIPRLESKAEKGSKRAKLALKLANDYDLSISSILFVNNVANIFASSFVTLIGIACNTETFTYGELVATIILTVFVIIFCEFTPKAFAKRFTDNFAIHFAIPVTFFKYLTYIFVWPIAKLFELIGKLFDKKSKEEKIIDEDVLDEMVNKIEEEGILEENEAEILRGAIDLIDIQAFEIMTPRVDVFAIDVDDDIYDYLKDEEKFFIHSRIPVYEDTIDNIIGVVNIKTLAPFILKKEKIDLRSLMYDPILIPRNTQVMDLLKMFKEKKVHIAVVIDEYGGTEGIVTMEDILEEIVGDIFDENDVVEEQFVDLGKGVYILDGSVNIDDAFEMIEYEDAEDVETDYSTIGGFCQEILERFAKKGDEFDFAHYHFEILEADEFTVEKLKITDLTYEEEEQ